MKLSILDLETTGLLIDSCEIIELAYLIIDARKKQILKMQTHLIKCSNPIPKDIQEVTGISQRAIDDYGKGFEFVIDEIHLDLMPPFDEQCQFIVGHNINAFDKPIFDRYIDTYSKDKIMPQEYKELKTLKVIDTSTDLPIPENIKTRKLTHLAYEHGIIMMPAHRAIVDCLMTAQLLFKYDIDKVIELSQEPKCVLKADIGGPWMAGFNEKKQLAIGKGFRWNPNEKIWSKTARVSEASGDFPFPVSII